MDSAKQRCYVAYDVSKATLMVAAPKGMPQGSLDNTQGAVDKQLQALIEHANRVNETLWLVCEATGGYQRTLEACAAKAQGGRAYQRGAARLDLPCQAVLGQAREDRPFGRRLYLALRAAGEPGCNTL